MARRGRPSRQDDNERRATLVGQLVSAMGSLHHLSQLSESPLCQLPEVVRGARESRVAYYPRAATLASAVRAVHDLAFEELAGTPDELPIQALGDALAGRSRADTAARLGVGAGQLHLNSDPMSAGAPEMPRVDPLSGRWAEQCAPKA